MSMISGEYFDTMPVVYEASAPSSSYFTRVKVERLALYILSTALIASSAALIGVSVAGVVTLPLVFISIPLMTAALGLIYYARTLKDYNDPEEVQAMGEKALRLSFTEIVKEHGLETVQKYQVVPADVLQRKFIQEYESYPLSKLLEKYSLQTIRFYDLMPLEMLRRKLGPEIQTMEMTSFFRAFPFEDLHRYRIIPANHALSLHQLNVKVGKQRGDFQEALGRLDRKYPERQERLLRQLDKEEMDLRSAARNTRYDIGRQASWAGYVARDMISHPDKREEARMRNRAWLMTEFVAVPFVEGMSDRSFQGSFERLKERREQIIWFKIGQPEQIQYDNEVQQLDAAHAKRLAACSHEFESIQRAISREKF